MRNSDNVDQLNQNLHANSYEALFGKLHFQLVGGFRDGMGMFVDGPATDGPWARRGHCRSGAAANDATMNLRTRPKAKGSLAKSVGRTRRNTRRATGLTIPPARLATLRLILKTSL